MDTFDEMAPMPARRSGGRKPRRKRRQSVLAVASNIQAAIAAEMLIPSPRTPGGSRGRHLHRATSFNTQLRESFKSQEEGDSGFSEANRSLVHRYCTKLEESSVMDSIAPLARRMFQVMDHATVPKDSREVLISEARALYLNLSTDDRMYDGDDLERWLAAAAEKYGSGPGARTLQESEWMQFISYQASRLPLDALAEELEVFISDLRQSSIVMNIQLTFGQEKTIDEVRRNASTIFEGIESELMPRAIECFTIMDVEDVEMITFEEALELYERLGDDAEEAKEEAMEMLESIDTDGSHVITRHDWLLYIEEICDQLTTPGQFEELCEELDSIASTLRDAAKLKPSTRRLRMDKTTSLFKAVVIASRAQRSEVVRGAGDQANAERTAALSGLMQRTRDAASTQQIITEAKSSLSTAAENATVDNDATLATVISATQDSVKENLDATLTEAATEEADSTQSSLGVAMANAAEFAASALDEAAVDASLGAEGAAGHAEFVEQAKKRSAALIETEAQRDFDTKSSELADAHESEFNAARPTAAAALDAYIVDVLEKAMQNFIAECAKKRAAEAAEAQSIADASARLAAEADAAAKADAEAEAALRVAFDADFAKAREAALAQCVQMIDTARERIATTQIDLVNESEDASKCTITAGVTACVETALGDRVAMTSAQQEALDAKNAEATEAMSAAMKASQSTIAVAVEDEIRGALVQTKQLLADRNVVEERARAVIDQNLPRARVRTEETALTNLRSACRAARSGAEESSAAATSTSFGAVSTELAAKLDAALDSTAVALGEDIGACTGTAKSSCAAVITDALETAHARSSVAIDEIVGACADRLISAARVLKNSDAFTDDVEQKANALIDSLVEDFTGTVHGERAAAEASTALKIATLKNGLDETLAAEIESARRTGVETLDELVAAATRAAKDAAAAQLAAASKSLEETLASKTGDVVNSTEAGARAEAESDLAALLKRRAAERAAAEAEEQKAMQSATDLAEKIAASVEKAMRDARDARHTALHDAECSLSEQEKVILEAACAESVGEISAQIGEGSPLDAAVSAVVAARSAAPAQQLEAEQASFIALASFCSDERATSDATRDGAITSAAAKASTIREGACSEVQHWDHDGEVRVLERMSAVWVAATQACQASVSTLENSVADQAASMQNELVASIIASCTESDGAAAAEIEALIVAAGVATDTTMKGRVEGAADMDGGAITEAFSGVGVFIVATRAEILDGAESALLASGGYDSAAVAAAFESAKVTLTSEADLELVRDERECRDHLNLERTHADNELESALALALDEARRRVGGRLDNAENELAAVARDVTATKVGSALEGAGFAHVPDGGAPSPSGAGGKWLPADLSEFGIDERNMADGERIRSLKGEQAAILAKFIEGRDNSLHDWEERMLASKCDSHSTVVGRLLEGQMGTMHSVKDTICDDESAVGVEFTRFAVDKATKSAQELAAYCEALITKARKHLWKVQKAADAEVNQLAEQRTTNTTRYSGRRGGKPVSEANNELLLEYNKQKRAYAGVVRLKKIFDPLLSTSLPRENAAVGGCITSSAAECIASLRDECSALESALFNGDAKKLRDEEGEELTAIFQRCIDEGDTTISPDEFGAATRIEVNGKADAIFGPIDGANAEPLSLICSAKGGAKTLCAQFVRDCLAASDAKTDGIATAGDAAVASGKERLKAECYKICAASEAAWAKIVAQAAGTTEEDEPEWSIESFLASSPELRLMLKLSGEKGDDVSATSEAGLNALKICLFRHYSWANGADYMNAESCCRRDYRRFIKESKLLQAGPGDAAKAAKEARRRAKQGETVVKPEPRIPFRPIFRGVTRTAQSDLLWQQYCKLTEVGYGKGGRRKKIKAKADKVSSKMTDVLGQRSRHPQRRHGANGTQMGAGSSTLDEYEWLLLMNDFSKKFCGANRKNQDIFPPEIVGRPSDEVMQIKFVEVCLIPLLKELGRTRIMESTVQAASGLERALRMEIKSAFHQSNLVILFEHYKHVAPQTGMSQTADHLSFRATLEMMKDFQIAPDMCNAATLNALFHDVNMCAMMKKEESKSYDGDLYGLSMDELLTFLAKVCSHVTHFSSGETPSIMAHKMVNFFKVHKGGKYNGPALSLHRDQRLRKPAAASKSTK